MDTKEQIADNIKRLQEERQKIDLEIKEYETALRVIEKIEGGATPPAGTLKTVLKAAVPEKGKAATVPEMCLAVLKDAYPEGLEKAMIFKKIKEKYGREVKSNTLTITLSTRLKDKELVRIEGKRTWFYVPQQNETPDGLTSDVSDIESMLS